MNYSFDVYVNMMSDEDWQEMHHVRRTESMVRQYWTTEDENILNAKMWGAARGEYTMTASDLADVEDLKALRFAAQVAGFQSRAAATQLNAAKAYETTRAALAGLDVEDPARADLQAQLDSASAETRTLVADRDAFRAAQNPPDAAPEVAP